MYSGLSLKGETTKYCLFYFKFSRKYLNSSTTMSVLQLFKTNRFSYNIIFNE